MIQDLYDPEIVRAFWQFAGSISLLIMIIFISARKQMKMEKEFLVATIRGFSQLLILASILTILFSLSGPLPLFLVLFVMIIFGARTAADRIKGIPRVFKIEFVSLFVSVNFVMILMTVLGVLPIDDPTFWIPIGGMIAGNSMNMSYLTLQRLYSQVKQRRLEVEAALSLGASTSQTMDKLNIISTALTLGVTPTTNNLKSLGLVFIPGLMTGLLIGGMHPVAAAFLQIMIFFIILGGGLLASLIASFLSLNSLFNAKNQALLNF